MRWEVSVEDVEKLHKTSRDVLGKGELALERYGGTDPAQELGTQRRLEWPASSCLPHLEESRGDGIELGVVEFVKLAILIYEDTTLLWQLRPVVVADRVVSEVVEDLKGQEEARRVHVGVPVENGTIYDFNMVEVSTRIK